MMMMVYLKCGDRYEDMIDRCSHAHNLRWYGTLHMDQKVCLNLVKKDQLRVLLRS